MVEGSRGVSYNSREGGSVDFHIAAEGVDLRGTVEITPLNLGGVEKEVRASGAAT